MQQDQEAQLRRDRLAKKQDEIMYRAEVKKKEELKRLDEEYSQKLLEEEKRQVELLLIIYRLIQMESENQEREKSAEQESMVL